MRKKYNDTLNLPKTDFPMKANLSEREPEILSKWQKNNIYKKILAKNSKNKKYIDIYLIWIFIVNSARFKEAKKYLLNSSEKNNFIKVYFTRKNVPQNILENTSSSIVKLEDKVLIFNKSDLIEL